MAKSRLVSLSVMLAVSAVLFAQDGFSIRRYAMMPTPQGFALA